MECSKSYVPFIVSTILLVIGYILGIVGVVSENWSNTLDNSADIGLWKLCWNWIKTKKSRICFSFSSRDHVPVMVFICSAFSVICLIVLTISTAGSVLALCQKRSRVIRWSRNCGVLAVLSDCGMALAVCLYAATYHDINYDIIPKWKPKTEVKLGWAFIICCSSAVAVFAGGALAIFSSLNEASKSKIIPMNPTQLTPTLSLHPPPSSRTLSPFPFNLQTSRAVSPLPFSRSKLLSKTTNNSPRARSPVFMQ